MQRWLDELHEDLIRLEGLHQRRQLVATTRTMAADDPAQTTGRFIERHGQRLINFASNDYLALADHPHLKAAAIEATQQWGTGSGASRLVTGHLAIHAQVEAKFAAFKHAQAALICPTGYLANLAVLTTLAGPGDLICIDKLSHASLLDAARFSGATVRVYPHLNHDKLERLLSRSRADVATGHDEVSADASSGTKRTMRKFIVTDSIFSMDGDAADLPRLCDLAAKYDAILIVDEAHGTGLYGATGAGLGEAAGVSDRIDITISTASKALGGLGGIITAKQVVIDSLINHARSFIYTTAIPASQAAAIGAALEVIRDEPWRRERVLQLADRVRKELTRMQHGEIEKNDANRCDVEAPLLSPIIAIITGSSKATLALSHHLASHGIHAPAIRPPTVALGSARVRLTLRADMTDDEVDQLLKAIPSRKA